MDTIWNGNPSKSEVIGRCGGDEKPNDYTKPTQWNAKTKTKKKTLTYALSILTVDIVKVGTVAV